ncbi:hypothetical protein JHK86_027733 [Glycine max]|nr:hypothetical protein JHK86_027733 [Glycine max]
MEAVEEEKTETALKSVHGTPNAFKLDTGKHRHGPNNQNSKGDEKNLTHKHKRFNKLQSDYVPHRHGSSSSLMVLQAIFNGAFLTMSSSSTTLFIGSSASTLVVVDSRHHQFPSLLFLDDTLNGVCPIEEKSDCLEGGPTMNSKLKELISHEGIIFWSDIGLAFSEADEVSIEAVRVIQSMKE